MTTKQKMQLVNAVVGLALIGAAVYLITIDRSDHVNVLLALGIVALGLAGVALPSPMTRTRRDERAHDAPRRPPPPPPPPLVRSDRSRLEPEGDDDAA